MKPLTLAARSAQPLWKEFSIRWAIWRFKRTSWTSLPRWQLQSLFLLLMAGALFLASHGSLWGLSLLFLAVSYLARCLDETWPRALEAHVRKLIALAREAQQAGHLNRALRHARTAGAMAKPSSLSHDEALDWQAEALLAQGHGAEALRAMARATAYAIPFASLRVRAHLQTGESVIALALARRMFVRAPSPGTARLIAQALLQLRRQDEARHFASLAGDSLERLAAVPPPAAQPAPARPSWETPDPPGLRVAWTGATAVGALLGFLAMDLPWFLWGAEPESGPARYALIFTLGAVQGGLLGLAQAWVLRRRVPESSVWPLLTGLGAGWGLVAMRLVMESGQGWPFSSSLPEAAFVLSLKGVMAACFQTWALGRWFPISASWLLAMLAAAPLAELAGFGMAGVLKPGGLGLQALFSALCRGVIPGAVGGALLHREWSRRQSWDVPPPPRPLAPTPPHVSARTRPASWKMERISQPLPVVPLRGKLFCPGADASFSLTEADFDKRSTAFSRSLFVIVPSPAEAGGGPGEALPAVGVLASLYRARQVEPGADYDLTVRMLARVRLQGLVPSEHGPLAQIDPIEDFPCEHPQMQLDRLRYRLNDYIRSTPDLKLEEMLSLRDPVFLADFIAANLELSLEERRTLLEDVDPDSRVARVCEWLDRELLEPPRPVQDFRAHVLPIRFWQARGE